jgi:hypothetical protein
MKRYNIVFDVHETLVTILYNKDDISKRAFVEKRIFYLWSKEDDVLLPYFVVKRPYTDQLLRFCENNFNIYIWSLGFRDEIEKIVKYLFNKQPQLIITRETYAYPIKSLLYLKNITNGAVNLNNTIQVDDREISISGNEDNGILIPPFVNNDNDFCFKILHDFLKQLMKKIRNTDKDIRDFDKNIFVGECKTCNLLSSIPENYQKSPRRQIRRKKTRRKIQ